MIHLSIYFKHETVRIVNTSVPTENKINAVLNLKD